MRKYLMNPYGKSLITIAYDDAHPVAIDAMWRNDIDGKVSYQTVDTCTLLEYRGRGLFRKITEKELEILGEDVFIYGFPNKNSYPGYKKFGWNVAYFKNVLFYSRLLKDIIRRNSLESLIIDYDYAKWFYYGKKEVKVICRFGMLLLVADTSISRIKHVLGIVDESTSKLFERGERFSALITSDKRYRSKRESHPVVFTNCNLSSIEFFRHD